MRSGKNLEYHSAFYYDFKHFLIFFHKNVSTLSQQLTPKIIKYLSPYNITKIAAGDNHTAALDCKLPFKRF